MAGDDLMKWETEKTKEPTLRRLQIDLRKVFSLRRTKHDIVKILDRSHIGDGGTPEGNAAITS